MSCEQVTQTGLIPLEDACTIIYPYTQASEYLDSRLQNQDRGKRASFPWGAQHAHRTGGLSHG